MNSSIIHQAIRCAILLIGFQSLTATAAEVVDYQANLKTPAGKANWSGWAERPQAIAFHSTDAPGGRGSVEFSVADGWNTAFINFPAPVRLTDRSQLRLYYKGTDTLTLNITNATEQVDYTMQASGVKEGDWYRAELIIADAVYKKGVTNAMVDGLEGDTVSRIQFATLSNKWSIGGLEIIRLNNPPEKKQCWDMPTRPGRCRSWTPHFQWASWWRRIAIMITARCFISISNGK